jgi:hypothetical protein
MIEEGNIDIEISKDLKKVFENFYIFIKKYMQEKHLYQKSSYTLINKINEGFENLRECILETDTGFANIAYNKLKKSSIDKIIKINGVNKRITKLIMIPSEALDIKAFISASGPNLAHFLDAEEVRVIELELGYCIITIHDCFLIDFLSCDDLVNIKINHYQKAIKKFNKEYDIKNIFIVL